MPDAYAHAILTLIEKGETPRDAVAKVYATLTKKGRLGLTKLIAKALVRIAARDERRKESVIVVAHAKDAKHAEHAAGVTGARVVHDPNLIGGWRLETHDSVTDMSWKKQLLTIYQRTVHV